MIMMTSRHRDVDQRKTFLLMTLTTSALQTRPQLRLEALQIVSVWSADFFLPTWCYASAVYAVAQCLCVHHKMKFDRSGWMGWASFCHRGKHSYTTTLMPGTHCHNICNKLLQLTFSSTVWKLFYWGRYRVQHIWDIWFNGIYKFTSLTYLLTSLYSACTLL